MAKSEARSLEDLDQYKKVKRIRNMEEGHLEKNNNWVV